MKTAFYIEDGREQIVLTPETEHEKKMLALLHDKSRTVSIKSGSFYRCQGGWTRHGALSSDYGTAYGAHDRKDDESTMLVLESPPGQPHE